MTNQELKNKLLDIALVNDNQYLDNYVNIIINNLDRPRENFKTQKHHIIPRYYYKYNNLKLDNSENNLVNLLYVDHALAHYNLLMCSTSKLFECRNWINNGIIQKQVKQEELSNYLNKGFVLGMLPKKVGDKFE